MPNVGRDLVKCKPSHYLCKCKFGNKNDKGKKETL